ncbi:SusC/RagA family TonB-linked outer membrane protein [Hymenobacter guriensis]|uniref:TonB-dependent receptor n=1 Tax=Hymenobacter guriensis TaxID=2793065 RepID=A0ABS0L7G1_9BACT|nr:TonB-dependent receptor [Hymenobacter guriensis]MBG8555463.1 TonB-dependent receptor [Hymenobacter guriensis]
MANFTRYVCQALLLGIVTSGASRAQGVLALASSGSVRPAQVDGHANLETLEDFLQELKATYKVTFFYRSQLTAGKSLPRYDLAAASLPQALRHAAQYSGLRFEPLNEEVYVIVPSAPAAQTAEQAPVAAPTPQSIPGAVGPQRNGANGATARADVAVSGRVTNGAGEGLPGVTIVVKGTTQGQATNVDGTFSMTVPEGSVLVFSSVGMVSREVTVTGPVKDMTIRLETDSKALGEVVVVAYGTQQKANVTGAINTVSAATLENRPVTTVAQALQGSAPNLTIQQSSAEPGAGLNINIRGVGTLGNASPLIIVDGIAGSLNALNPNDIESVTVLKDAASAAIYGSRGANGVLLVTTKQGALNQKPVVIYNTLVGMQAPNFQRKPVSGLEFMQLKNEALVNSGQAPQFSPQAMRDFAAHGDYEWHLNRVIRKEALQQNHNLSLSGSAGQTRYLLSLGYVDQNSLFYGDNYGFKRLNTRLNLTTQVTERLKVGGIFTYAHVGTREHAFDSQWIISDAARIPRIYPVQDAQGNFVTPATSTSNSVNRLLNGGLRTNSNDNGYANLNAEFEILKGLKLRGLVGGDLWNYQMDEFRRSLEYVTLDGSPTAGGDGNNAVRSNHERTLLTNYQATLNYELDFNERHAVQALVGYSTEDFTVARTGISVLNVPGNDFGVVSNGTAFAGNGVYGNNEEWALNSMFGRLNYAFANKYLIEGSFRYDGSSRFASESRWGFFPSVSVGWRPLEENFLDFMQPVVSDLKLRASLGQLGNQNIGLYRYLSTISLAPGIYSFGGQAVPGNFFNTANRDITWETSTMGNVGLDAGFLQNALTVSVDVFDKRTNDILIDLPVAGVFGAGAPTQNAASVRNQGWEVALTYRQRTDRGYNHSLTLNAADSRNTVTNTQGVETIRGGDATNIIREGFPINSYFGLRSDGLYQTPEEVAAGPQPDFVAPGSVRPGDIRYIDRNGDGRINQDDRFILGNPFPRYTFGATYTADYKGFDLLVFVQGVGKRSLYIRGEGVEAFHNNWENVYTQHLDRWTPTNPDASYPRLTIGTASTNNIQGSDYWLRNAAYARLKNVQLGYSLPTDLTGKVGIKRLRIFASGQDLYTISKLKKIGFDPEVSEFSESIGFGGGGGSSSGRVYPAVRVVSLGLDVSF